MRWHPAPTKESRKKDLERRIEALERELAEAEAPLDQAIALNNLGAAYADLDDWAKALEQYRQAAATAPEDASLDDRLTPHGNASNAARRIKDWPAALHHALVVDAVASAAGDEEHQLIAAAAVGLVRKAVGQDEFAALLTAGVEALDEPLREAVRSDLHLNPTVVTDKPGRNDPCPCGSGKKYKHCCLKSARDTAAS